MGIRDRILEGVESRTGYALEKRERLNYLEESDAERKAVARELDLLAYTALDYLGGQPQELRHEERRRLAQKCRVVWMRDPQAGAAIDLMNDFVFGRGLPKPKANDEKVQEVIDEAWDDPDNQLVLTTYAAQVALGTDLTLQSNVFVQVFDDGDDGKVKLGILDHDRVERAVRDPENRRRVLYYVSKESEPPEEDYKNGTVEQKQPKPLKTRYYEHWRFVDLAREESDAGDRTLPKLCPPEFKGDGRVFHIALNRTTEMAFGHPQMDRLLRWYTAYNRFMDARVDIMEASAAFVMKKKVKGTPSQLKKMATQALSRGGAFGSSRDPDLTEGPKPASVLLENEEVTHEDFNINTNAPAAAQDAQMLRSQISAATRWPQSYYGDASQSTLATATSLELPVLKAVEARQEMVEQLVRFFVDRVVERAVDVGKIESELTDEERAELEKKQPQNPNENPFMPPPPGMGATTPPGVNPAANGAGAPPLSINQGYEDQEFDEDDTARDLGYQFSMPSPLRRLLTDLVTAIQTIATTFDPNGTNVELSRTLLTIALGEGLEMEDPGSVVERIFPEGYKDPAMQAPGPVGGPGFGEFGGAPQPPGGAAPTVGPDGQLHFENNPYGAPMASAPPEKMRMQQASAAMRRAPPELKNRAGERLDETAGAFDELFGEVAQRVDQSAPPSPNGRH